MNGIKQPVRQYLDPDSYFRPEILSYMGSFWNNLTDESRGALTRIFWIFEQLYRNMHDKYSRLFALQDIRTISSVLPDTWTQLNLSSHVNILPADDRYIKYNIYYYPFVYELADPTILSIDDIRISPTNPILSDKADIKITFSDAFIIFDGLIAFHDNPLISKDDTHNQLIWAHNIEKKSNITYKLWGHILDDYELNSVNYLDQLYALFLSDYRFATIHEISSAFNILAGLPIIEQGGIVDSIKVKDNVRTFSLNTGRTYSLPMKYKSDIKEQDNLLSISPLANVVSIEQNEFKNPAQDNQNNLEEYVRANIQLDIAAIPAFAKLDSFIKKLAENILPLWADFSTNLTIRIYDDLGLKDNGVISGNIIVPITETFDDNDAIRGILKNTKDNWAIIAPDDLGMRDFAPKIKLKKK